MRQRNRQNGAALLVSLMLLFVMTTLGISAMKSATMENRMVGNAYAKDLTFQAAESASDFVLADDSNLEAVICATTPTTTVISELDGDELLTTSVALEYGGETVLLDNSLDLAAIRFVATGTSIINNTNTRTSVAQGAVLIGPKSMATGCQ